MCPRILSLNFNKIGELVGIRSSGREIADPNPVDLSSEETPVSACDVGLVSTTHVRGYMYTFSQAGWRSVLDLGSSHIACLLLMPHSRSFERSRREVRRSGSLVSIGVSGR